MKQTLLSFLVGGMILTSVAFAQEKKISGRVTSADGKAIPGVTVVVQGTNQATQTDTNGNYSLNVPAGKVVVFRSVGFDDKTIIVNNNSTVFNVSLESHDNALEEVVVTANAIKREKRSLGYSAPTIKADELTEGRNSSAINSLAGKVAGVNITSTSNSPGSSSRVVLRGGSSISGNNQALIVVDGTPIDNTSKMGGSSDLASVDFGNRGNDINPDDIASVTVLKGPAAAALYGSRASNGALIITTKSGKKGSKNEITFSSTNTLSSILKLPEFQNQYGQGASGYNKAGELIYTNDPKENWSWGAPFTGEIQEWGQAINGVRQKKAYSAVKDNVKDFFDLGIASDNNLSFSGGSEKSTFYLGLNSLNSNGVYPGKKDNFNKYGVRFNGTTEFSNKFSAGISVNYSRINSNNVGGGQGGGSVYNNLLQTPRDIDVVGLKDLSNPYNGYGYTDANGVAHNDVYGYYGAYTMNPYWVLENYNNFNDVNRIMGNFNINYKPTEWLTFQERIGLDNYSDRRRSESPKYSFLPIDNTSGNYSEGNIQTDPGQYRIDQFNVNEIVHDFMATAKHTFNEDWEASLMVGNNIRQRKTTSNSTATNASGGLVVPGWYNLANSNGPLDLIEDTWTNRRLVGVYGDLNVSYKNIAYLQATARNDWSSTLPKKNNSFFYPSVSGSFVASELFSPELKSKFSYAKIRANWAQVGSDTDPYQLISTFSRSAIAGGFGSTTFPFGNVSALMSGNTIGNLNLKPEITTSFEVGTELGFLNNRLSADFTYYKNNSKNQILSIPIPLSTGYGLSLVNAGKVQNSGVELTLRGTPVKTENFSWELFGTFTKNNSKVVELMDGVQQVTIGGFSGMSIVAAVGRPYGEFYAVTNATDAQGRTIVDQKTGLPIASSKPEYLGTYNPDFQASLGTSLNYKNWSMSALFDTKQGGVFYSRTKDIMGFVGTSAESGGDRIGQIFPNSVYLDDAGNSVVNTTATYDKIDYYPNMEAGVNVVDATYIKLRNLTFTYKFSKDMLKNTPFGAASIGVFGNNLFIWTPSENKYADPEVNSSGAGNAQGFDFTAQPSLRNYGINVKVSF
ncbi:SusC/RagA family TonB-linked outer membrane protein [Sphingobacterium sp. InxBP1]|uniref:SusC/RagA family TonB-linked outer membrane protein n=1 Tax=Sphingobacterium sp. InxBP1 TaxID=2870328 RepID=UPI00224374EA|nr:SusC/RagA family TonB-linked outer membrane protein [Sphingobacterium sp. InxBP1]MCW8312982.1 SusC/RagA family TonB-linked outer membrane protein [Sphingobacterium sp. InxBP1]